MTITLETPDVDGLGAAIGAVAAWQVDGAPMHLHPGDIGWFGRFGADAAAAAVRVWRRDGQVLAVGLLDGADLLRMTTAPDVRQDEELGRALLRDITDPARGVLGAGEVSVESPRDAAIQELLSDAGWGLGDPWTPLRRDLADPVEDPGVRVEVVGPDEADLWDVVTRASFGLPPAGADRWLAMAAGVAYTDARSLLAYDDAGVAVASIVVWSAGPGRPGLVEPMGVHPDHRGCGYGTAVTVAGAAVLRELGARSLVVATPSANVGAVATYRAAGFREWPRVYDKVRRPA